MRVSATIKRQHKRRRPRRRRRRRRWRSKRASPLMITKKSSRSPPPLITLELFLLIGIIVSCLMSAVIISVTANQIDDSAVNDNGNVNDGGAGDHIERRDNNTNQNHFIDNNRNNNRNNRKIGLEPISNLTVEEILFQPGILQMKINWNVNVNGDGIGPGGGTDGGTNGAVRGHGGSDVRIDINLIPGVEETAAAVHVKDDYVFDVSILPILYPNSMCSKGMCEGSTNHTEIRLPSDPTLHIEPIDCKIEPNCEYNISVKIYKPIVHYQLNLIYRVQDCIFNVCSCNHASKLPNATVTAADYITDQTNENTNGTIDVHWSLTTKLPSTASSSTFTNKLPSEIDIEMIEISIIQVNDSKETRLTFYENLRTASGELALSGHQLYEIGQQFDERNAICVKARIRDTHQCFGYSSIFEIAPPINDKKTSNDYPSNENQQFYKIIYATAIVIIFIILIVTILSCYIQYRLTKHKNATTAIQLWRGVYQSVPSTTGAMAAASASASAAIISDQTMQIANGGHQQQPQIPMQSNFLYINKDIFDARSRGEADQFEVPHSCLTFGREIGKGAFGRVFIAHADNLAGSGGYQMVAVKKLKKRPSSEELEEFLTEIITMKSVPKHPNVVSLLGCCTIKQPFLMIMEYIGCGDLLKYLRDIRHKHESRMDAFKRRPLPFNRHHQQLPNQMTVRSVHSAEQLPEQSPNLQSVSAPIKRSSIETIELQPINGMPMTSALATTTAATPSRMGLNGKQQQPQQAQPQGKYLELLHSSHSESNNSDVSCETTQNEHAHHHQEQQQQQQQQHQRDGNERPSITETLYTLVNQSHCPTTTRRLPDGDRGGIDYGSSGGGGGGGGEGASTADFRRLDEWIGDDGSLLEILLDNNELHNFAIQIARGMRHLEEQKITHRDLAARNVLIDANKTLKISDFGLSRSGIYVNKRNKKVPLRWLSIEAMSDNLYSNKSDVWAYGIVLWEIGTLGAFPYPTVANQEMLNYLRSGQRLPKPDNCSEFLYQLMLACWHEHAENRPNFIEIVKLLDQSAHQKIYVDFNELAENYTFPPTIDQWTMESTTATMTATAATMAPKEPPNGK